jgi:hypothetical protein
MTHQDSQSDAVEAAQLSALHNQFRSITMLLTLLTAVNNQGYPTLGKVTKGSAFQGVLEPPQPHREVLLNALAAILVRDTEVVAVVCDSYPPYSKTPLEVVAVCDEWSEVMFPDPIQRVKTFSAFANPNGKDRYPTALRCCVQPTPDGSHWPKVCEDPWYGLLSL